MQPLGQVESVLYPIFLLRRIDLGSNAVFSQIRKEYWIRTKIVMNTLVEKIKSLFRGGREKSESEPPQKPQSETRPYGAGKISKLIRESEKFQTQKKLWRNIFH